MSLPVDRVESLVALETAVGERGVDSRLVTLVDAEPTVALAEADPREAGIELCTEEWGAVLRCEIDGVEEAFDRSFDETWAAGRRRRDHRRHRPR